jgi:hypothetical protein
MCSKRCRNRALYLATRAKDHERRKPADPIARARYQRDRMRRLRREGLRREYEAAYYRRPEVQERYRLRWRELYGDPHPDVILAEPYTGHRWLEMARAAVGRPSDASAPWADDAWDDMGEAVLALLEGRDMKQAIAEYRSQEYVSRRLTIRADDWREDDDYDKWFDSVLPAVPSAEDSFFATPANMGVRAKFHKGSNRRRFGNNQGRQEPAQRRRRRDAGWRAHAA